MECKYPWGNSWRYVALGINRYIMECKSVYDIDNASHEAELIDTLWNVNFVHKFPFIFRNWN